MSYWDTRVLVRLDQAECAGTTWLLGLWYLSVMGLLEKWFTSKGYLAPDSPVGIWAELRRRSRRGASGGPPERTLRRLMSAEYKRYLLIRKSVPWIVREGNFGSPWWDLLK
ncbi:hypothetical protein PIB30_055666 [Stylosanthes scabra]|uniref:Uncharacterized protein n=1 Tax=Stylosanthes scabra TaxID=79078 RepID=A0ABU6YGL6_9FABA|nr:hypothetical protein [Stylosanthes scabra]